MSEEPETRYQFTTPEGAPQPDMAARGVLHIKPHKCEECHDTGIVGDEGPGMKNAFDEWTDCECIRGASNKETEERVIAKIRQRRDAGRAKYGKTMERKDIDLAGWLTHLQEELLDATIYIERALKDVTAMRRDIFRIMTPCAPKEQWTGREILARLDCDNNNYQWAHLRLDEAGWCYVIEDGATGSVCLDTITSYVILPNGND